MYPEPDKFDITRQDSWTVQPRLGFTYMLTEDARNVLRGSWVRLGEQVMGQRIGVRDATGAPGGRKDRARSRPSQLRPGRADAPA